jgi:hypothetical protein
MEKQNYIEKKCAQIGRSKFAKKPNEKKGS